MSLPPGHEDIWGYETVLAHFGYQKSPSDGRWTKDDKCILISYVHNEWTIMFRPRTCLPGTLEDQATRVRFRPGIHDRIPDEAWARITESNGAAGDRPDAK